MPPRSLALVALGGNALLRPGEDATLDAQRRNAQRAARAVARLARRHRVVVTHGNGPQVGHILARSEIAAARAYPLTLDVAVAESEGELGYVLQQALDNATGGRVVTLLTQSLVSARDPAFRTPTKPIGPVLDERRARALRARRVPLVRVPGGWRRVVASPRPRRILEADAVRRLARSGYLPIAAGGGGVPVVRRRGRLEGVEAVVDKDLASCVLALEIGASFLFLLTDVDGVYEGFGTSHARRLDRLTPREARRLRADGELPAGSMGPKVEAALRFLARRPRGRVVVGSLDRPESGTLLENAR